MQQNELKKNHANYAPLTPIVFLEKAAKVANQVIAGVYVIIWSFCV